MVESTRIFKEIRNPQIFSASFSFSFPIESLRLSLKNGGSFKVNTLEISSSDPSRRRSNASSQRPDGHSKIRAHFNDWEGEGFPAFVRAHRNERGREHG